jgi:hypothetical protein
MKKIIILLMFFAMNTESTFSQTRTAGIDSVKKEKKIAGKSIKLFANCSPYRLVTGYVNLCKELNSFNSCNAKACIGNMLSTVQTNYLLDDLSNQTYFFSSTQAIAVSVQHNIIQAANSWAAANKPNGYSVLNIHYSSNIVVGGGVTSAGITIKVTYYKCNGSRVYAQ